VDVHKIDGNVAPLQPRLAVVGGDLLGDHAALKQVTIGKLVAARNFYTDTFGDIMTLSAGTETTVNTMTAGPQTDSSTTTLDDGRWVVTWDSGSSVAADRGVRSQVFNADGSKFGSEIAVFTTIKPVGHTSTTALADGGWLVTYEWADFEGSPYLPAFQHQQRFNSDGTPNGAANLISVLKQSLGQASVTDLPDGGWIVVWADLPVGPTDISMQRYDSSGVKVGGNVTVNTSGYGGQTTPDITVLNSGGWLVTWASDEYKYDAIYTQAFNADGTRNGGENKLVGLPTEPQPWPTDYLPYGSASEPRTVALDGGGYVVTWTGGLRGDIDVYFQIFDDANKAISTQQKANPAQFSTEQNSSITALDTGGFVISWESGEGSGPHDIYCQAFNADGSKNGDQVLVNTTTAFDQIETSVTALAGGSWAVTWTNIGAGNSKDVMQKVFHLANDAPAGTDATIDLAENMQHAFTMADFGFSDSNNNLLAHITITDVPDSGILTVNGMEVASGTTLSVAEIATLVWTPTQNTSGDGLAALKFTVGDDGGTANGGVDQDQSANTITFNVAHVNRAPIGTDAMLTMFEDRSHAFTAADFGFSNGPEENVANNLDKVIITGFEASGTLTFNGTTVTIGQVIDAADLDKLIYTPPADSTGAAGLTLTFKVVDDGGTANGGVDTAMTDNTLTIEVAPVNDAPTGADALLTIDAGATFTFSSGDFGFSDGRDTSANGLSQVIIDQIVGSGKFMFGDTEVVAGTTIDAADISSLTFTGNHGEAGQNYASLVFRLVDDGGTDNGGENTQALANTITLDVAQINSAPAGADALITIREDAQFLFSADRFGFSDPDDDPSNMLSQVVIRSIGGHGTFMLDDQTVGVGDKIDAADIGLLAFTGDANGFGKNYASLEFVVVDDGGTANGGNDSESTTHTITFDVLSVADAPLGSNSRLTIKEDVSYRFSAKTFGFSDPVDGDVFRKVIIDKFGGHGDLLLSGKSVHAGQTIKAADLGKLTFTGEDDGFGHNYASIKFRVVDNGNTGNGGINTDFNANSLIFDLTDVTDKATGKAGKDRLVGTVGHDVLDGRAGNDTLTGKAGEDTFVFKNGYDRDVITDFVATGAVHDILDIRSLTAISGFHDLLANHATQTKVGIVIDGLHGDVITLRGVHLDDLGAADFMI
jgi:hypothetical protein